MSYLVWVFLTRNYKCAFVLLADPCLSTLDDLKAPLSDLRQILATDSPLKMMKNAFISSLSSFRFQDIYIFVLTFWLCSKRLD